MKMTKNIKIISSILAPVTIIIFMSVFTVAFAAEDTHKNMEFYIGYKQVDRVEVLEKFFEKYNSPLKGNAQTFVEVADKYGIDFSILPSISCIESTCGKQLIKGSYNPFGWGVYGSNYIAFNSYDEAIKEVGEGLSENYFSKGLNTLEKIAPVYTPPNSRGWYRGVRYFSSQIAVIAAEL